MTADGEQTTTKNRANPGPPPEKRQTLRLTKHRANPEPPEKKTNIYRNPHCVIKPGLVQKSRDKWKSPLQQPFPLFFSHNACTSYRVFPIWGTGVSPPKFQYWTHKHSGLSFAVTLGYHCSFISASTNLAGETWKLININNACIDIKTVYYSPSGCMCFSSRR